MPSSELARRISQQLDQLGPKERQLAEFLLTHEAELAMYSSADMARLAKVSKPVVSRFFKRLGYDSFMAVREDLRRVRTSGSPLLATGALTDQDALLASHLAQEARNWQLTLSELQHRPLAQIADALCGAGRVKLLGLRNSYPVALHWRQQLLQLRADVELIPSPGQTLAEELANLTADDLVVLVALRRRPALLNRVMPWLATSPARTLLITDPTGLELAAHATWALPCHQLSPGGFASYASAMAMVSLLCNLCQQRYPASARVNAIDDLYAQLEELEG